MESALTKILIFNMNLEQCITEYLVIIFAPIYQFIRMNMMKISLYGDYEKKKLLKNLFITILILLIVSGIFIFQSIKKSSDFSWQGRSINIFVYIVLYMVIFFIFIKYNKHRYKKYEKEFDDK